jgi:transcriptional regulator with XRE-family HTH domain
MSEADVDNDIAALTPIGDAKAELVGELKRLFDNAEVSTREVGQRANCAASTVHRAVNGRNVPGWETLSGIVRVLGGDQEQVRGMWDRVYRQRRAERDPDPDLQGDGESPLRVAAARLDARRREQGISIRQLARRAGYSRSTLHGLLQGSAPPTSDLLNDVLQSLRLTSLEIRSWQTRFRYATEAYRQARQDARAREVPFSPELAEQLQSFRKTLRRNTVTATVSTIIAVVMTVIAVIAVIMLSYPPDPNVPPGGSAATNTSALTPSSLPPIEGYVALDEGVKIYEQPRIDSIAVGIVKNDYITVECQIVTAESVADDETSKSSPIWFKIILGRASPATCLRCT